MAKKSDFIRILEERGFISQATNLEGLQAQDYVVGYIGFDATADSLHVGHLVQIMALYWLQQTGNKPVVLMGGGTSKVGDPSGRDESRQLLDEKQLCANIASIKKTFTNYVKFGPGKNDAVMADNAEWLDRLEYIPFLREVGRHFSVNRMLTMDSVKLRLEREQPLSFLEFNYMILQAYDFLELNKRYKCALQMGGADQWGNIVSGIDLVRRLNNTEVFGVTTPLITTSSGAKMGKTAAGAVWLAPHRLSPYDFWQFWRNTEDADVGRFLKLFTALPMAEIAKLEKLKGNEINEAKKILANEATKLCHGEKAALEAAQTAVKTFEQGGAGENLPQVELNAAELEAGIPFYELLTRAGLVPSNSEGRRLIKGGGARLNDQVIEDDKFRLSGHDLKTGQFKISAGKKKHALVKLKA
ncbi:MAG: tyrosine--tRNA ligase [Dongiaceae bacterium]